MANVFISHSRKDAKTVDAFCRIFARTTLRAILAEFEAYAIPPWLQIKGWVNGSSALFVLLSPHLRETAYTQNWVSYEVGLACASNKPVWVYEQWQSPVMFPIPYLTDYVVYDPESREQLNAIKRFVEVYDPTPALGGAVLGALVGAAISGGIGAGAGALIGGAATGRKPPGFPVRCPHQLCGIQFRIHNYLQVFPCPACRQTIQLNWVAGK